MAKLKEFKVAVKTDLDLAAANSTSDKLSNTLKKGINDATRDVSLNIESRIRTVGSRIRKGGLAAGGLAAVVIALVSKLTGLFNELKEAIGETGDKLLDARDKARSFGASTQDVIALERTLQSNRLNIGQDQIDYLLNITNRIMAQGTIGNGKNEREITFSSNNAITSMLELLRMVQQGTITFDELGISGRNKGSINQLLLQNDVNEIIREFQRQSAASRGVDRAAENALARQNQLDRQASDNFLEQVRTWTANGMLDAVHQAELEKMKREQEKLMSTSVEALNSSNELANNISNILNKIQVTIMEFSTVVNDFKNGVAGFFNRINPFSRDENTEFNGIKISDLEEFSYEELLELMEDLEASNGAQLTGRVITRGLAVYKVYSAARELAQARERSLESIPLSEE